MGLLSKFAWIAVGAAAYHLWSTCPKQEEFDTFFKEWFENTLWPKMKQKDKKKNPEKSNNSVMGWIKSAFVGGVRTVAVATAYKLLFPNEPKFTMYHFFIIAEVKMRSTDQGATPILTFIGINGAWYHLEEIFDNPRPHMDTHKVIGRVDP